MEQAPKLPERRMGLVFSAPPPGTDPLRTRLRAAYREDETQAVERILAAASLPADAVARIAGRAQGLVAEARRRRLGKGGIDALLHQYALSTPEGGALMCLAEALLRIPAAATLDRPIPRKPPPPRRAPPPRQTDPPLAHAPT